MRPLASHLFCLTTCLLLHTFLLHRARSLAPSSSRPGNDSSVRKDALWCGRPSAELSGKGPPGPSPLTPAAGGFGGTSPSPPAPAADATGFVTHATSSTAARVVASTSVGAPLQGALHVASPTTRRPSAAPDPSVPVLGRPTDSTASGASRPCPANHPVLTTPSPTRSPGELHSAPSSGLSGRERQPPASTFRSSSVLSTTPQELAPADLLASVGVGM